jgi:hypothetical protein
MLEIFQKLLYYLSWLIFVLTIVTLSLGKINISKFSMPNLQ